MSDDDWYRNTDWTAEISAKFEERLVRARGRRSEYLRVQAVTLAQTKRRETAVIAIDLARRYLLEPDGIFAAQMHGTIARAYETLGQLPAAIDAHRLAIGSESKRPNVRGNQYIDFAWFVAAHELAENYAEALAAIERDFQEQDLVFPANQYRYFASLAVISAGLGDEETSRRMATNALDAAEVKKGPFWRYPRMGLVNDDGDPLRAKLRKLAK